MSGFFTQTFRNIPVPNPGLALYTISLRYPGVALLPSFTYTFPLSPQSLRKEYSAMSVPYNSQGSVQQRGVQRNFDIFGSSPFDFVIEGTTGQQRHSSDGYLFTGRQSIDQIMYLLKLFDQGNQSQMNKNMKDLYTIEFYDYFTQEFWQVVPVGPQGITQSAQAPTLQYYRFRFAGVKPVNAPLISNLLSDQVAQLLIAGQSTASTDIQNATAAALGIY